MKATLLIISLLIIAFVLGAYWQSTRQDKNSIEAIAIGQEALLELQSLDSLHMAQADMLRIKLTEKDNQIDSLKKAKSKTITYWRTDTTYMVMVDTVVLMECDSAISVGNAYMQALEVSKLEAIELRQVASIKDSMLVIQGKHIEAITAEKNKQIRLWQLATGVAVITGLILVL